MALLFIAITLVAIFGVTTIDLYNQAAILQAKYDQSQRTLNSLLGQISDTAQSITLGNITISFTPYQTTQKLSGDAVTYLYGFVYVSNLTKVVARPIDVSVSFFLNISYPTEGNGQVTYEGTADQILNNLPPEIDAVPVPWSAYPVQISGFAAGDVIVFELTITASVIWIGQEVETASLTTHFQILVTKSSPNAATNSTA